MNDLKKVSIERSWFKQGVRFYIQDEHQIIQELNQVYPIAFRCHQGGFNLELTMNNGRKQGKNILSLKYRSRSLEYQSIS